MVPCQTERDHMSWVEGGRGHEPGKRSAMPGGCLGRRGEAARWHSWGAFSESVRGRCRPPRLSTGVGGSPTPCEVASQGFLVTPRLPGEHTGLQKGKRSPGEVGAKAGVHETWGWDTHPDALTPRAEHSAFASLLSGPAGPVVDCRDRVPWSFVSLHPSAWLSPRRVGSQLTWKHRPSGGANERAVRWGPGPPSGTPVALGGGRAWIRGFLRSCIHLGLPSHAA